MKKIVSLFLVITIVFGIFTAIPLSVQAYNSVLTDGDFEYLVEDNEAILIGYKGSSKSVTIPATLGGYRVTTVGKETFVADGMPLTGFDNVTSVTIGNNVRRISRDAFRGKNNMGLENLTTVKIESGVVAIGSCAFCACKNLKNIQIADSVISLFESSFSHTAWYNSQPNGVIYIGKVLYGYKGNIPNNYTLNVKDGTLGIASGAFWGIIADIDMPGEIPITKINVPDSVCYIGINAFKNTSWDNKQNGPVYLGKVFYHYYGNIPQEYKIKDGTIGIAGGAFSCYNDEKNNLAKVTLPESINTIGCWAFSSCDNLLSLTVPKSLKLMEDYSFGASFDKSFDSEMLDKYKEYNGKLSIYGYTGNVAERYAKNNYIKFNSLGFDDEHNRIQIFSDCTSGSLKVGEQINIGASILNYGEPSMNLSSLTFTVNNNSVLSTIKPTTYSKYKYLTLKALKEGNVTITVSDSKTGYTAYIPITVYNNDYNAYTIYNVPKQKIDPKYVSNFYNVNGLYIDSFTKDENGNVSFNVYNHRFSYGAVEVYKSDGSISGIVVIDKNTTSNGSSIKECLYDKPKLLINDYIISNNYDSYRGETNCKETKVSVKIPQNGYIKITVDGSESFPVSFINIADLLMTVKSISGEIKGFDTKSYTFEKTLTKKMVESTVFKKMLQDSPKYVKTLMKNFAKEMFFKSESLGNFAETFVKNIDELDLFQIIKETATSCGFSLSEDIFKTFSGPIGLTLKGMFTFAKTGNALVQLNSYLKSLDGGSITIHNSSQGIRYTSEISVKSDTEINETIALKAFQIKLDENRLETIKQIAPSVYNSMDFNSAMTYNISLIKNGETYEPSSKVEVVIPIPDGCEDLADLKMLKIYRVEDNGQLTEMSYKVKNSSLIFTTDHFSVYSIVPKNTKAENIKLNYSNLDLYEGNTEILSATISPVTTSNKELEWTSSNTNVATVYSNGKIRAKSPGTTTITAKTSNGKTATCKVTVNPYLPGDINGDGKVNMKDIVILQQYLNGWNISINKQAADVNKDNNINMKDIVLLQQYLNGWKITLK